MAEVEKKNMNGTSEAKTAKKRKGFLSNLFSRSSKASEVDEKKGDDEKKEDQEAKHKGGLMNSFMDSARQAVTHEAEHLAENEAEKEIEALINNNNGSQPTNTSNGAPDTTTTSPSDALNATTNWAKRMVDSAQQKMQGLQSLAS